MSDPREEHKQKENDAKRSVSNYKKLEADAESAAADAEPMGSVAAAVPGSDRVAQDAAMTGQLPGAESPMIRNQPKTTAGTEAKLESEEAEIERKSKQPGDRKSAA